MTHDLPDLRGRVAMVTGGSRGLGREIVRAFARAGAHVVIASRRVETCEELASEIRAETGRTALSVGCHVGDWGQLEQMVDVTYRELGRLDIVVNNAGLSPVYESLADVDRVLWDKIIAVNLGAPFRLTTLAAPRMAAAGAGSIINISSVASVRPRPSHLPYAAAKAGLNVLTQGFAAAYGPEVRVNGIMAGPFATDMTRGWDPDASRQRLATYPLRRVGAPDEIVGAALYFASDAASFTTGAVLAVDGGMAVA